MPRKTIKDDTEITTEDDTEITTEDIQQDAVNRADIGTHDSIFEQYVTTEDVKNGVYTQYGMTSPGLWRCLRVGIRYRSELLNVGVISSMLYD